MKQYIVRKGSFDAAHRIMNEKVKCFNIHGHTYLYEIKFEFDALKEIGYAIDFKEIKRIGCQYIDDYFDHGIILNAKDTKLIEVAKDYKSKLYVMSLNGENVYCNPSVENIAKEIFLSVEQLFVQSYFRIDKVTLYETPNCYTVCIKDSISETERINWNKYEIVHNYRKNKGNMEYDDRK